MARKFAFNFIAIQRANETVNYHKKGGKKRLLKTLKKIAVVNFLSK